MTDPEATTLAHERWMRQALVEAGRAYRAREVPVGALVVREEEVLGSGWNQPISAHDPSAHAEIVALRQAGEREHNYRLPGATLYVTIEPCTMCLGAIIHARIARVVFGAPEPKAGVLMSNPKALDFGIFNHRIEWQGGILAAECTALIQRFFQERRAQKRRPEDA